MRLKGGISPLYSLRVNVEVIQSTKSKQATIRFKNKSFKKCAGVLKRVISQLIMKQSEEERSVKARFSLVHQAGPELDLKFLREAEQALNGSLNSYYCLLLQPMNISAPNRVSEQPVPVFLPLSLLQLPRRSWP